MRARIALKLSLAALLLAVLIVATRTTVDFVYQGF